MILVTGTKRSGTSMWMQILIAGGLPYIGEPYMGPWESSIRDANPRGFYESLLRQGVFYATNPHPDTGRFLFPDKVRRHAVKVFIPGLVRTDYTYIDHVVATMRHWREYGPSLQRLHAMEDAWLAERDDPDAVERARRRRSPLPPEVEWWFENYDLIRDVATRRYKVNLSSYDRMLSDPEPVVRQVFAWLGHGDADAALRAIEPGLRTQRASIDAPVAIDPGHAGVLDELCATIHAGQPLSPAFLGQLNDVQAAMVEQWGKPSRERAREDAGEHDAPAGP